MPKVTAIWRDYSPETLAATKPSSLILLLNLHANAKVWVDDEDKARWKRNFERIAHEIDQRFEKKKADGANPVG